LPRRRGGRGGSWAKLPHFTGELSGGGEALSLANLLDVLAGWLKAFEANMGLAETMRLNHATMIAVNA
jgi:hypothetical protein